MYLIKYKQTLVSLTNHLSTLSIVNVIDKFHEIYGAVFKSNNLGYKSINRGDLATFSSVARGSWRSPCQKYKLSPHIAARKKMKVMGNPPALLGQRVFT